MARNVAPIFADIDGMDADKFISHLTPDVRFRFANMDPAIGHAAVKEGVEGFWTTIAGLTHHILKVHEMHLIHDALKPICNSYGRFPSGFIAVEHHDDISEMFRKETLLPLAHRGTHERDARKSRLRHVHTIEKSFDEHDGQLPFHPMQIKKFERLVEARRKSVTGFRSVDRSPGIRDENALPVVDRNHDAIMHRSFAGKKSHAKCFCNFFCDSPLREIRMSVIDVLKRERERLV